MVDGKNRVSFHVKDFNSNRYYNIYQISLQFMYIIFGFIVVIIYLNQI